METYLKMNGAKKKQNVKRLPRRSPDQGTLTVSCPLELRQRIGYAAALEKRTVSNWTCVELDRVLTAKGITYAVVAAAEQTAKAALSALKRKPLKVLRTDEPGGPSESKS